MGAVREFQLKTGHHPHFVHVLQEPAARIIDGDDRYSIHR